MGHASQIRTDASWQFPAVASRALSNRVRCRLTSISIDCGVQEVLGQMPSFRRCDHSVPARGDERRHSLVKSTTHNRLPSRRRPDHRYHRFNTPIPSRAGTIRAQLVSQNHFSRQFPSGVRPKTCVKSRARRIDKLTKPGKAVGDVLECAHFDPIFSGHRAREKQHIDRPLSASQSASATSEKNAGR